MTRLFPAILIAALAAAATPARAQPIDLSSGGPIEITARGGFEWREGEQKVLASGDARAVRGDVTVLADELVALYRKKGGGVSQPVTASGGDGDTGGNEVYRLEASGHVRILTPTDEAQGDHAIYDIDQSVLVMTGHALKLTTPQQILTARDSLEYWTQLHMAVGRGDAVVVTTDARRLSADTLVGYTTDPNAGAPAAKPVAAKPSAPADPLAASGKLQRIEAFGNVEVRTTTDTVRGDRGVYVPDTGIARVVGHVRITRGQSQLNGPAADVNMKTGIAHLIANPGGRVQGLIVPNDTSAGTGELLQGKSAPAAPKPGAPHP